MLTLTWHDSEFQRALNELARISWTADQKIVETTARFVAKGLAINTPLARERLEKRKAFRTKILKWKGYARTGWLVAWSKLRVTGSMSIGNSKLRRHGPGDLVNRSRDIGTPHIKIINNVDYIIELDKKHNIVGKTLDRQAVYLRRSIERVYTAMLKGKSG